MFPEKSIAEFIDLAASDAPTPGGGGIAALAGALGACMASMAGNFTVGKPKFAAVEAETRSILAGLAPLIARLRDGIDADAVAFESISAAYKLPRESDADKAARRAAVEQALTASMRVPLAVLADCLAAAAPLPRLAAIANPNLLSDVEVAAIMLDAAGRAARVNVMVNAGQLTGAEAEAAIADSARDQARLGELLAETLAEAARRRG